MKLPGVYHIEPILMSLNVTRKPSALKEIFVKRFEIHFDYSFYGSTIPHFFCCRVEFTHESTIMSGTTLIYLAGSKMTPFGPHRVECEGLQARLMRDYLTHTHNTLKTMSTLPLVDILSRTPIP